MRPRTDGPGRYDDTGLLLASLPRLPQPATRPVLVVMSGLPGTGKSTLSRALAARFPMVHVQSDALRRVLFPRPTYAGAENVRLFPAAQRVIGILLDRKLPVLFDATNLVEAQRALVYRIAEERGSGLVIVRVVAPEGVVWERLARRGGREGDREDRSEADWETYLNMRDNVEPIRRPHVVVDTTRDTAAAVRRVVARLERAATGGAMSPGVSGRRGGGGPRRGGPLRR